MSGASYVLCIFTLCCITSWPRPGAVQLAGGAIAGEVRDTNGAPMPMATIRAISLEGKGERTVVAGDDGRFLVDKIDAGRFHLSATRPGYLTADFGALRSGFAGSPISVSSGELVRGLVITLVRGAVIKGTIRTGDGLGASRIPVALLQYRITARGERVLMPITSTSTDEVGRFVFMDVAVGPYVIRASTRSLVLSNADDPQHPRAYAPTYYPGTVWAASARAVRVTQPEETVDLGFELVTSTLSQVTGRVTRVDGAPTTLRPSDLLIYTTLDGKIDAPLTTKAIVDADRFVFEGLFPGTYFVKAVGTPGNDGVGPSALASFSIIDGSTSTVFLVLSPTPVVSGYCRFEEQGAQRAVQLQVSLFPELANGFAAYPPASTTTRPDGSFEFQGLIPGRYRIEARPLVAGRVFSRDWAVRSISIGDEISEIGTIDVPADRTIPQLRVSLTTRLSEVTGTLLDAAGQLATSQTVIIFPSDKRLWAAGGRMISSARPDQNGVFVVRGLPKGDYNVATLLDPEPNEWLQPELLSTLNVSARLQIRGDERIRVDVRLAK